MVSSSLSPSLVEQALRQSPFPAIRELSVSETDSQVVISGWVTSYYLKQLAQETILPHIGDRALVNRVAVELRQEIRKKG